MPQQLGCHVSVISGMTTLMLYNKHRMIGITLKTMGCILNIFAPSLRPKSTLQFRGCLFSILHMHLRLHLWVRLSPCQTDH